jgi:hypothetical protein
MVNGLDIFKERFKAYPENYIIIGGTACDIIINQAGLTPRATKDIDIILVVEALTPEFVKQFWEFIKEGNYERREKDEEDRKYYRFLKPEDDRFPYQVELFSRKPDLIHLDHDAHLTPIPVDDDLSSLSAILLNDDYYNYLLEHSVLENGLHRANIEALLCLKAKAYLEISDRIAKGGKQDSRHLRKHKGDVFRLAVMLAEDDVFALPESLRAHLETFVAAIAQDLPGKEIFKEMGVGVIEPGKVLDQIINSFRLKSQ